MIRFLDLSFDAPAENLAFDEILLDGLEYGHGTEATLRLWESPVPFVVLGCSQKLEQEAARETCEADGVPTMRRCTAGGCVLQGPGCLNFSLALPFGFAEELRGLHRSYRYILGRIAGAIRDLDVPVDLEGISDLASAGRKFSGNAQRRRQRALLHHGTLLHRMDYSGMERYLQEPVDRPEYRGAREHRDFVAALPLSPRDLRQAVRGAFGALGASTEAGAEELARTRSLASEKYLSRAWIHRR